MSRFLVGVFDPGHVVLPIIASTISPATILSFGINDYQITTVPQLRSTLPGLLGLPDPRDDKLLFFAHSHHVVVVVSSILGASLFTGAIQTLLRDDIRSLMAIGIDLTALVKAGEEEERRMLTQLTTRGRLRLVQPNEIEPRMFRAAAWLE